MTHPFAVWAPRPRRVTLRTGLEQGPDTLVPMAAGADGWWHAELETAGTCTRYAYVLDDGPLRPDPRSAFQPLGVDGPSEVVDHGDFAWTDARWRGLSLRGAVLYELHIGTFTPAGTFEAAIERLPHLVELGVDAVEIMPVAEFAGSRGWGYDGVDLFAPHHAYGGPTGCKRLVDACHDAGLGVVLDVVYNHLGPAGNHLAEFGPYFSDRHTTNWGAAVNFDGPQSDEVRRFVIDNATMWLRDYHMDGLRLDAVHAIVDDSALHLLEELSEEIDALAVALGRPLFLVAESDRNDPRLVRPRDAGGYGLDASWADEWHHALHAALTGERSGYYEDFGTLAALGKALGRAWVYDGGYSPHRRRRHGRQATGIPGHRFVVNVQNHDQIGNRAAGERLGALVSPGRAKVAAALLLTSPFTPMLFQGEEWNASSPFRYFTDHEPELGDAVRRGRRQEFAAFGWAPEDVPDPQDPATFEVSKLDWDERSRSPHAELLDWYAELVDLRRRLAALSDPRLDRISVAVDEERGTLLVRRGEVVLFVNLGPSPWPVALGPDDTVLAASWPSPADDDGTMLVPADAVAIVGRAPPTMAPHGDGAGAAGSPRRASSNSRSRP